ncbi:MAG: hypothetical protein PUA62_10075, partial [Lachnospiraceae bacterium]|nr:hypothetical protein [Lachnospiraceae bacterium]
MILRKKIIKVSILIVVVINMITSNVFSSVCVAESQDITYDELYDQRNNHYKNLYGITYEQLFKEYPEFICASDTHVLKPFYDYAHNYAEKISKKDEIMGSLMEVLQDPKGSVGTIISVLGGQSPYERQLKEVTQEYLLYMYQNDASIFKKSEEIYEKYKGYYKSAGDLKKLGKSFEDEDFFTVYNLMAISNGLTEEQIKEIRKQLIGKKDIIEFNDVLTIADYFFFLVQMYEVNYESVKILFEYQKEGTVLYEGLNNYLNDYNNFFMNSMLDYYLNEVVIDKICDELQTLIIDSIGLKGAWTFTTIIFKYLGQYYTENRASATEITKFYIISSFVNDMDSAVYEKAYDIYKNKQDGIEITRKDIDTYEVLYTALLDAYQMYMDYAGNLIGDNIEKRNLSYAKSFLIDEYNYDTYIDICMRRYKGEEITVADIPVYRTFYTINCEESITIDKSDNGFSAYKTTSSGKKEELLVIGDKLIGGINLQGGTLIVNCDANISALTTKDYNSLNIYYP